MWQLGRHDRQLLPVCGITPPPPQSACGMSGDMVVVVDASLSGGRGTYTTLEGCGPGSDVTQPLRRQKLLPAYPRPDLFRDPVTTSTWTHS